MKRKKKKITNAIIISDIHLGWAVCNEMHTKLLKNLHKITKDAVLIILNGDIIDHIRKSFNQKSKSLIHKMHTLVTEWRSAGKEVVYIEGNHDRADIEPQKFGPEYSFYEFLGYKGEKIQVFHGHDEMSPNIDRIGKVILSADNYIFSRFPLLRPFMKLVICRLFSFIAYLEDLICHHNIKNSLIRRFPHADIVVHGHMHQGPFFYRVNDKPVYSSGSWVSDGQIGVSTGLLRYRNGEFERLDLVDEEWESCPLKEAI